MLIERLGYEITVALNKNQTMALQLHGISAISGLTDEFRQTNVLKHTASLSTGGGRMIPWYLYVYNATHVSTYVYPSLTSFDHNKVQSFIHSSIRSFLQYFFAFILSLSRSIWHISGFERDRKCISTI